MSHLLCFSICKLIWSDLSLLLISCFFVFLELWSANRSRSRRTDEANTIGSCWRLGEAQTFLINRCSFPCLSHRESIYRGKCWFGRRRPRAQCKGVGQSIHPTQTCYFLVNIVSFLQVKPDKSVEASKVFNLSLSTRDICVLCWQKLILLFAKMDVIWLNKTHLLQKQNDSSE